MTGLKTVTVLKFPALTLSTVISNLSYQQVGLNFSTDPQDLVFVATSSGKEFLCE